MTHKPRTLGCAVFVLARRPPHLDLDPASFFLVNERCRTEIAGYLTTVTMDIGGEWLGIWIVFAAAISNIALFRAEMSGDAYQLMGMANPFYYRTTSFTGNKMLSPY